MPVSVWRDLIRLHYPNTGWVRLNHDTVEALAAYKSAHGMLGFDDAVTSAAGRSASAEESRSSADWDRVRTIADAVLYEGYLLYPYRATRERTSRAGSSVYSGRLARPNAGIGEDDTMSAQCCWTAGPTLL